MFIFVSSPENVRRIRVPASEFTDTSKRRSWDFTVESFAWLAHQLGMLYYGVLLD
jgi:hypothetical protein